MRRRGTRIAAAAPTREDTVAIKLHRCSNEWLKIEPHPCWRVQKALDEAGVEHEIVKHPVLRWKRKEYERRTGQRLLPAIEFPDETILREESADLVARIKREREKFSA